MHLRPNLAHGIISRLAETQSKVQVLAQQIFRSPNMLLSLRPESIPYPALHMHSMQNMPLDGGLFQARMRIFQIDARGNRVNNHNASSPYQIMRAALVGDSSAPGDARELRQAKLLMEGDALQIFPAPQVGQVMYLVGQRGLWITDQNSLEPVIRVISIRQCLDTSPSKGIKVDSQRQWPYVAKLADMLRDPELSETGSSSYFALATLLSCVIAQSSSTAVPIHLLVVGNVLHDCDRMMHAAARASVKTYLTPPTMHQVLTMGVKITTRGICRILDLEDMAARQHAQCNKLVEFLGHATAAVSGTIWASVPKFDLRSSEEPLSKDIPNLAKNGLLRCFAIVHRCPAPTGSSIEESHRRGRPQRFDPVKFDEAVADALYLLQMHTISASARATRMIEGFIMVSRKLRNTTIQEVSIHDVGLTFVLARAHAALSHRIVITEEDAAVAIYVCEESFLARTGRSILSFSNQLGAGKSNMDFYSTLAEFQNHIDRLLSSHGVAQVPWEE